MKRRVPILATMVVLLAVAVMVGLGWWQLKIRLPEKEQLIARYSAAQQDSAEIPWASGAAKGDPESGALYHRSRLDCQSVAGVTAVAGENMRGDGGMAHVVNCRLADGSQARVVLGWSRDPNPPKWAGGEVTGIIAPGPRLVADPPLAGLEANAKPDPRDIPNNHFAYAIQWFLFALTALVIYVIALGKRMR